MKILAVDDERLVLDLLIAMARTVGFTDITTATSGPMALDTIANADCPFDCVLLDISMPEMDGIELCSLVRTIPTYHRTPILMLTAMSTRDYIDRAFRAGATDYLNKPFEIVELTSRLRKAQEIVEARQKRPSGADADARAGEGEETGLGSELAIEGVADLVTYTALQNYLTQLSHVGIAGSQVVAVKIEPIDSIFNRAPEQEFLYILTEIAEAISSAFADEQHLMAYTGNGIFAVVSSKVTMESSTPLEARIQALIDERQIEFDNGQPLDVDISIGNPIRPSLHRTQRVKHTFDRAIGRAESRVQKKRGAGRAHRLRLVGP